MTPERKEAVEELDRAVNACVIVGIFRTDKVELSFETANTLRGLIDDADPDALVEIETLRRWKQEQLTVTAWWQEVDDYIRKSPDAPLGANVAALALKWLRQRRELLVVPDALRTVLGAWRTDLVSTHDHLPFGSDSRDKITAIIKQIDELLPTST